MSSHVLYQKLLQDIFGNILIPHLYCENSMDTRYDD